MKGYRCVAWGDNKYGQCDVPEGERFIQIDASGFGSVGLRVDGTAVLWGGVKKSFPLQEECGQFPPEESFKQVSISPHGTAYGLRHDGSVLAVATSVLEPNFYRHVGPLVNPVKIDSNFSIDDRFIQIASGGVHFVGLREDGTVLTRYAFPGVYKELELRLDIPAIEEFTQVACGDYHTVGLRPNGTIGYWGADEPDGDPDKEGSGYLHGDRYQGVVANGRYSIGVDYDDFLVHSSYSGRGPGGHFYQVAGGRAHCVGIRQDHTILCWGSNCSGQCDAPDGVFRRVAAGEFHSLGLVID